MPCCVKQQLHNYRTIYNPVRCGWAFMCHFLVGKSQLLYWHDITWFLINESGDIQAKPESPPAASWDCWCVKLLRAASNVGVIVCDFR